MSRGIRRWSAGFLIACYLSNPLGAYCAGGHAKLDAARVAALRDGSGFLDLRDVGSVPTSRALNGSANRGRLPAGFPEVIGGGPLEQQLPGEFERQEALLLACRELALNFPDLLGDIVQNAWQRITVMALVCDDRDRAAVCDVLARRRLPTHSVRFLQVPHDSVWLRDFGPFVVRRSDGFKLVVDAEYGNADRLKDERVPANLAVALHSQAIDAPINLEGGNLLSNGEGLCITTTTLIERNAPRGFREQHVRRLLRTYFGSDQIVFLEPLLGEPTGHVDMFATFTSADTVVVGAYDPEEDRQNAEILDRNSARLAEVVVSGRQLRVVRVPMPSNADNIWRTYTNGIYANGALLVPVYPQTDGQVQRSALATFQNLLPGWDIVPVDAAAIIGRGGALHCISMNVLSLRLLEVPSRRSAVGLPSHESR